MRQAHTKTYIFTFGATFVIFMIAFVASSYLTNKKIDAIKSEEAKISIDILSLETKYDLLKEASCKDFNRDTLRQDLDTLADKLQFIENQVGANNQEVFRLKRYYSVLEIKDYLLTKQMSDRCKLKTIFVMYFYANKNCDECQAQEYYLRAIHDEYPQIEIYSFDYSLDLTAVQTLISLHNVPPKPPVIDINGTSYASFDSLQSFKDVLSHYIATSTATTTKASR